MNGTKIKKLGCTGCPNYCEPRAGYPAGTCLEVPSYQHGLDKIEECPLVEQGLIQGETLFFVQIKDQKNAS